MKRYEIENTTSINNIKNVYNELVKSLDCMGYTNLLRNNYFKNKFYNREGVQAEDYILLAKWRDYSIAPPAEYDGTIIDGTNFKFLESTINEDTFGILTASKSIYQIITFNELERMSHNGILNLSLFFVKKSTDTTNASITLEYSLDNWTTPVPLVPIDNSTEVVAGEFTETATEDFYTAGDKFVFSQNYVSYNIKDDATFKYVTTTHEIQFRVVITNPATAGAKYFVNALAYFGRSDASSFVKNIDDAKSGIEYDSSNGEYYISTDGQDKVYLSVNKYFLTVGTRGSYATINDAIATILLDDSSSSNDRIIYLTSDTVETADVVIPDNVSIIGNGHTVSCGTAYKVTINSVSNIHIKDVIFKSVKLLNAQILSMGTTGLCSYVVFENCQFLYTEVTHTNNKSNVPFVQIGNVSQDYIQYCKFINCYVQTGVKTGGTIYGFMHDPAMQITAKYSEFDFNIVKNFGYYNSTAHTWDGSGIYMVGSNTPMYCIDNKLSVKMISLIGFATLDASIANTNSLYAIELGDYASKNIVSVIDIYENSST